VKKSLFVLFSVLVVSIMVLGACAKPTAAPTAAPTEAPKPTEAPTAAPTEAPWRKRKSCFTNPIGGEK